MVCSPLFTYKLPAVDVIITKLGHQCHSHPCRELVDAILDFRKASKRQGFRENCKETWRVHRLIGISWEYVGNMLGICWECVGNMLGTYELLKKSWGNWGIQISEYMDFIQNSTRWCPLLSSVGISQRVNSWG